MVILILRVLEVVMLKKLLILLSLIFTCFNLSMAEEGKTLTIIYTNDVIGEVEPCG